MDVELDVVVAGVAGVLGEREPASCVRTNAATPSLVTRPSVAS